MNPYNFPTVASYTSLLTQDFNPYNITINTNEYCLYIEPNTLSYSNVCNFDQNPLPYKELLQKHLDEVVKESTCRDKKLRGVHTSSGSNPSDDVGGAHHGDDDHEEDEDEDEEGNNGEDQARAKERAAERKQLRHIQQLPPDLLSIATLYQDPTANKPLTTTSSLSAHGNEDAGSGDGHDSHNIHDENQHASNQVVFPHVVLLNVRTCEKDYNTSSFLDYISTKYHKVTQQLKKHVLTDVIMEVFLDYECNGRIDQLYNINAILNDAYKKKATHGLHHNHQEKEEEKQRQLHHQQQHQQQHQQRVLQPLANKQEYLYLMKTHLNPTLPSDHPHLWFNRPHPMLYNPHRAPPPQYAGGGRADHTVVDDNTVLHHGDTPHIQHILQFLDREQQLQQEQQGQQGQQPQQQPQQQLQHEEKHLQHEEKHDNFFDPINPHKNLNNTIVQSDPHTSPQLIQDSDIIHRDDHLMYADGNDNDNNNTNTNVNDNNQTQTPPSQLPHNALLLTQFPQPTQLPPPQTQLPQFDTAPRGNYKDYYRISHDYVNEDGCGDDDVEEYQFTITTTNQNPSAKEKYHNTDHVGDKRFKLQEKEKQTLPIPPVFENCLFFITGQTVIPIQLLNLLISTAGGRLVMSVGSINMYTASNPHIKVYVIGNTFSASRYHEMRGVEYKQRLIMSKAIDEYHETLSRAVKKDNNIFTTLNNRQQNIATNTTGTTTTPTTISSPILQKNETSDALRIIHQEFNAVQPEKNFNGHQPLASSDSEDSDDNIIQSYGNMLIIDDGDEDIIPNRYHDNVDEVGNQSGGEEGENGDHHLHTSKKRRTTINTKTLDQDSDDDDGDAMDGAPHVTRSRYGNRALGRTNSRNLPLKSQHNQKAMVSPDQDMVPAHIAKKQRVNDTLLERTSNDALRGDEMFVQLDPAPATTAKTTPPPTTTTTTSTITNTHNSFVEDQELSLLQQFSSLRTIWWLKERYIVDCILYSYHLSEHLYSVETIKNPRTLRK